MRNTLQKEAVLRVVLESCDHPNAESIYIRSKMYYPTIGRTTVYRSLTSLSNEGKILKISCPTGDRFDKTLYPHIHLKCSCCGGVSDLVGVNVNYFKSEIEVNNKIKIDKIDFLISGVCEECNCNLSGTTAKNKSN